MISRAYIQKFYISACFLEIDFNVRSETGSLKVTDFLLKVMEISWRLVVNDHGMGFRFANFLLLLQYVANAVEATHK